MRERHPAWRSPPRIPIGQKDNPASTTPLSQLVIDRDPAAATLHRRRPWWRSGWAWLAVAVVLAAPGWGAAPPGRAVPVQLRHPGAAPSSPTIAWLHADPAVAAAPPPSAFGQRNPPPRVAGGA